MYGKLFASTFTGSMYGAGAHVFAVWSYAIANADVKGYVEINAAMLAPIIGEPKEKIVDALKKLIAPDPESRTKSEGGARMVREGQFIYRLVNQPVYRKIRDEDERRLQQRVAARDKRAKSLKAVGRDRPESAHTEVEVEEEGDQRRDSAVTGGPAPAPFMVFPVKGEPRSWNLSKRQVDRWQEMFPGLDVPATMRDCLVWQEAAPPGKQKTARGMTKFLSGWLIRNQDSGRGPRRTGGAGGGGDLDEAQRRLFGGSR